MKLYNKYDSEVAIYIHVTIILYTASLELLVKQYCNNTDDKTYLFNGYSGSPDEKYYEKLF